MIKQKHNENARNNVTVLFGYGLFIATVISFIISTLIPFGSVLINPNARHANIIIILIVFAVSVILPALFSYLIGDKVTHVKNKTLHHYNGVLFGIAAYWLATTFNMISVYTTPVEASFLVSIGLNSIVPVILTLAVMTILAIYFVKSSKNTQSVLYYRPFQILLSANILIFFGYLALNQINASESNVLLGLLAFLFPAVITLISYSVLGKHHAKKITRLTDALVAMSIAWIATPLASAFFAYTNVQYEALYSLTYVFGIAVWVAYLYFRIRK
jgi:hypothetical protein